MGTAKDAYEIVADVWDRINGAPRRRTQSLADYLEQIASLLGHVRSKFEKHEVPREEAKKLALLISDAHILAAAFKKHDQELAKVFDKQLPHIGLLMRDADLFIDKRPRYYLHESFDVESPRFPSWAEQKINEACEELQRAAGVLSAYAFKFAQQVKRAHPLSK
jgi:hypothetical protein